MKSSDASRTSAILTKDDLHLARIGVASRWRTAGAPAAPVDPGSLIDGQIGRALQLTAASWFQGVPGIDLGQKVLSLNRFRPIP